METIDDPTLDTTPSVIDDYIDWTDQTDIYYFMLEMMTSNTFLAQYSDDIDPIIAWLNNYLPTFQSFYETSESKFVYHLKCPETKYTFYMDADKIEPFEELFDAYWLILLDWTVFVSNDRIC